MRVIVVQYEMSSRRYDKIHTKNKTFIISHCLHDAQFYTTNELAFQLSTYAMVLRYS